MLGVNLKKGFVKLVPENFDDLWHLYNVVFKGDEVFTYTTREIKPDEKYARPRRGQRVPVFLGLKVEKVLWDKLLNRLRVHGTISEAPESVPKGAHHTLSFVLNKPITIVKDDWEKHHLARLKRASQTSERPIMIVVVDDEGYAIATTKQYGVEILAEERVRLPGKLEAEKRTGAVREHFMRILASLRVVWKGSPIAIIGVGFLKGDFADFVKSEASDVAKSVVDVKGVNNSGVAGINEALRSGILIKAARQLRVVEEVSVVGEILRRLGKSEPAVAYGYDNVWKAAELGAVEKLVLADGTLREGSDEKRLTLESLMKSVEEKRGSVMIISTEHEAGAELTSLGGVAALLRFPLRVV